MKITLSEVGTYINGYAFKPSDWGTSGLPIIRIQNLTNQNTEPNYFDGPYNSKFEVNKGDILIAWSGSLGIHIWQKNKALLNQHIFRVEFNKCDIDKMYFYYAVKYNIHKMLHLTHGATMRHIIKSDFEQIIIPYPRLEAQAKISKVLNYLDQNIINYRNILIKLELLIKSRFVEMFGDLIINSKRLNTKRLDELFWLKAGITTPPSDILSYMNSSHKYLCYGGNGVRGYVKYFSYSGIFPLIGRQGALCGNAQLAQGDFHATEHAILVKPLVEYIDVIWSYYALRALNLFRYHSGAAQPGISVKTLNNILLPIPILSEQKEFVLFSNQINKLKFA